MDINSEERSRVAYDIKNRNYIVVGRRFQKNENHRGKEQLYNNRPHGYDCHLFKTPVKVVRNQ